MPQPAERLGFQINSVAGASQPSRPLGDVAKGCLPPAGRCCRPPVLRTDWEPLQRLSATRLDKQRARKQQRASVLCILCGRFARQAKRCRHGQSKWLGGDQRRPCSSTCKARFVARTLSGIVEFEMPEHHVFAQEAFWGHRWRTSPHSGYLSIRPGMA